MKTSFEFIMGVLLVTPFSLLALISVMTLIPAFLFGVTRWKRTSGKMIAIVSGLLLALFAAVILSVFLTVESGSMGVLEKQVEVGELPRLLA